MRACILTSTSIVSFFPLPALSGRGSLTGVDMAANGEIRVNQAKRGYDVTGDEQGLIWVNP